MYTILLLVFDVSKWGKCKPVNTDFGKNSAKSLPLHKSISCYKFLYVAHFLADAAHLVQMP